MKKLFVALLVLAIMSATVGISYAAVEGGGDKKEAKEASDQTVDTKGKQTTQKEGKEYLIAAWGRYGPIALSSGFSNWWRIYYPGCFLGTPSVQDSLEVQYPWTQRFSIGVDKGYSFACRFDARVSSEAGSLTGSVIDWHARR